LDRHRGQLLLDGDSLVELLKELGFGGVSLHLANQLLECLHLALDLSTDLLLLLFKSRVFSVVSLKQALVLGKYLFLRLGLVIGRHQIIRRVSLFEQLGSLSKHLLLLQFDHVQLAQKISERDNCGVLRHCVDVHRLRDPLRKITAGKREEVEAGFVLVKFLLDLGVSHASHVELFLVLD